MKKIKSKLRAFLVKIYYKFYFLQVLRRLLNKTCLALSNEKNHDTSDKAIKEINSLMVLAKKNNQPIFIQFPIIAWSGNLFQRPQQLAKAMAERGYLTIYLLDSGEKENFWVKISNNLYLSNRLAILENLKGAVVSVYLNYPPSDLDKYLTTKLFENNTVFYEHVDHIDEQISGKHFTQILKQRYKNLRESNHCDFIIGTSKALYNELLEDIPDKKIVYLPNGVDTAHYKVTQEQRAKFILPEKIKKVVEQKRIIIGFFGAIAPWIWDELIIELADKRPEYFILMIGPESGDRPTFPKRDNIYSTGTIDYQYLPLYAEYFDVSIIPFRLGDLAKATSPVKLFEYFTIGKPIVVTSDLVECTKFEGVASANCVEDFITEIDKAVKLSLPDKAALAKKYKEYAENNSWAMRAKKLEEVVNSFHKWL